MADLKISQLNSLAGSSLAATDELAVVDTSASETKKITSKDLVQYGYGLVNPSALDGDIIEPGTTSARGTVQLTDSTSSTSTTTAATPNAVKAAYDLANAAMPKAGGTMTGQILGDNSTSASTPGYAFDGDPNTGLYTTGADELALTTGGSARLTIDSTGTVVIPGNFTVQGTTTTIDTTTLVVKDKNIEMGAVTTPTDVTADGGGITLKGTTDKTINWVDATDAWTSSERFSIPLGSAAAPSLTINGDANSGLYSPGADQLALATNGTGRLFVNANGQIGIGTNTSLLYPLNIQSGSGADAIMLRGRLADDKSTILFVNNGAATNLGWIQVDATGFAIATGSAPTERLRIDATGQIEAASLGTAAAPTFSWTGDPNTGIYSPGADQVAISTNGTGRLFVDASGNVQIAGNLQTGVSATTGQQQIRFNTQNTYAGQIYTNNLENLWLLGGAIYNGTNFVANTGTTAAMMRIVQGAIRFETNSSLTPSGNFTPQERLRITSTGALNFTGAGTAGVTQAVSFNGSAPVNSLVIDSSGRVGIGTSSPGDLLTVSTAGGGHRLRIERSGTTVSTGQDCGGISFYTNDADNPSLKTWDIYQLSRGSIGLTDFYVNEGATNRLLIQHSTGNVGIGTTSPSSLLDLSAGYASITWNNDDWRLRFRRTDGSFTGGIKHNGFGDMSLWTADNERARIDSSGRLLVGTSTARGSMGARLQLEAAGAGGAEQLSVTYNGNNAVGAYLEIGKTRGTSVGSNTAVINGDELGAINFMGANGTDLRTNIGARIQAVVDAEPFTSGDTTDLPSRLVFSTTADGASSPTERARFTSNGYFKASRDGTYDSSTGLYHELNSNSDGTSLFVRNSSASLTSTNGGIYVRYSAASPNSTTSNYLYCDDSSALRASIRSNGGLANYQANNVNLSDRNAKKDISPAAATWDCIKEWEIVNYRYKDQPADVDLNLGVIAQQVAESCPEVITVFEEAKDDQPEKLGVKEQQMYWMAIKALQEAQARIEALEAKVVALESKP